MCMFLLLSLLVMMVVPVIRRGAGNSRRGGGRGRGTATASKESRNERGGETGSTEDSSSPLTHYFERADRSVSCGDFHKMPKDGEPKKGIVEFTGK